MPAVRLSRRRRSSLAISFTPAKAGIYGIRPVTFAPNVTPVSFVENDDDVLSGTSESGSSSALFPPSQTPAPPPSRRRAPPGKRRSMGYIPRPPNAFMLFRADFVRQKHVPGNCWRALPLEEKRTWEIKAKHAKAEHKARYPEYRFKPVHNKNKDKKKEKPVTTVEDERRCEEVAQLLLEGKKGDELAEAVRSLDRMRSATPIHSNVRAPVYQHRRSSSVPLPDYYTPFTNITLPSAPFFTSRPSSPLDPIARQQQRMMLGNRRASSARPAVINRSWTMPMPSMLQRDESPLPDVDTSLFNPQFLEGSNPGFSFNIFDDQFSSGMSPSQAHDHAAFGPLDNIAPHDFVNQNMYSMSSSPASLPELDQFSSWMAPDSVQVQSHPSTAYSGSPEYSGSPTPPEAPQLHAPQPQSVTAAFADMCMWKEFGNTDCTSFTNDVHSQFPVDAQSLAVNFELQPQPDLGMACAPGLDSLFQQQMFNDSTYDYPDIALA
ncbi:hypothetical protein H0H81_000334 [Sphagnurus paluster]|uniref:HMG box domain-containing protein n=1 Tax=Sphagnurus paluster TaxID=117069 RepID=A0A9P7KM50_9AGAR|nr:hypothetical protein H0H81_000334 [Sphagnurus paluster]